MNDIDVRKHVVTMTLLSHLQKMGYTEVWIATDNPHWTWSPGSDNVVASPPKKHGSWPALWHAAKEMGGLGCGNGLRNADQCQIKCYRDLVPGYYALEGDHFVPGQTQQGGRTK